MYVHVITGLSFHVDTTQSEVSYGLVGRQTSDNVIVKGIDIFSLKIIVFLA